MTTSAVTVTALEGMGEVREGDDLAALLVAACARADVVPDDGDVLVVSSKVLAKALGLWHVDREAAVAAETRGVVAERRTPNGITRIVRSAAGPVMAAAGVDASNTGPDGAGRVLVLPRDPDVQAARLRADVRAVCGAAPGVLLTDTSGRPWRVGQTDFALGCAGLRPTDDLRGGADADGALLSVTVRAVADEIAGAAELVKGKADGVPAALVRGCGHLVTGDDGPGAAGLVRFDTTDWFATGTVESVRAVLGCPPGTPGVEPGPASPDDDPVAVLARTVAVVAAGCVDEPDLAAVEVRQRGPLVRVRGDVVPAARVAERLLLGARAERLACAVRHAGRPEAGPAAGPTTVTLVVGPA